MISQCVVIYILLMMIAVPSAALDAQGPPPLYTAFDRYYYDGDPNDRMPSAPENSTDAKSEQSSDSQTESNGK